MSFASVSGSTFVLKQQFGLDEPQFGLPFGASVLALTGGAQLNPLMMRRFTPPAVASGARATVVAARRQDHPDHRHYPRASLTSRRSSRAFRH